MESSSADTLPIGEDQRAISAQKIEELLKSKDDTSRFVGLALLKSVLDNSAEIQTDEATIVSLWESVPPRFLDRLLRTGSGSRASQKDGKDMLDIAVAVLHTFASLLPDDAKRESKLVGRIPLLTAALLPSSETTTKLILQTLLSLVSFPDGARALLQVEDVSPLVEVAPSQPLVLDIFYAAWVNSMANPGDRGMLTSQISQTTRGLVSTFKGTDAVTLLDFLAQLLRSLGPEIIPYNLAWVEAVVAFIHNLVSSKPTPRGRTAYTNMAASLLQAFPAQAPQLLFAGDTKAERPFSYLFINLILIDLRSSFPTLLEQLNSPAYADLSARLGSAFDVLSSFVGYLVQSMDEDDGPLVMPADLLLKLRKAISETLSAAMEHLRDRWDASVAGALGLHPDARATTPAGQPPALAWDAKTVPLATDGLVLAAVRAVAVWLREDDGEALRREATGLCDMLVDLYRGSGSDSPRDRSLDFRRPVLVALEGITAAEEGVEIFLSHDGWRVLTDDLLLLLRDSSASGTGASDQMETNASRGTEIVRVLLPIAEAEQPAAREDWMSVVTVVAAWDPDVDADAGGDGVMQDFQCAVLQLATALLVNAHPVTRRRYVHSASAVRGVASRLRRRKGLSAPTVESLDDVVETLGALL